MKSGRKGKHRTCDSFPVKNHIPNGITLLNLVCGTAAVVFALEGQWTWAVYLVLAAAVLDFLDGLAARLLKATSSTGKQLDSLADMVTFGLLPAVFVYSIFIRQFREGVDIPPGLQWIILASIALIPVFSAIRLARFNVRESSPFFIGLPTPAHGLFWTGIYWQYMDSGSLFGTALNAYFLWAIMLIMAMYMIMPVPMYSLKFEGFRLRGNLIRYVLLAAAALILAWTGIPGLTLVVLTYILLSLLNHLLLLRVSS